MTEREKIIDITKVLFKNDLEYGDYFEIDKEALDLLADTLIENGIGDISEWKAMAKKAETELEKYKRALSCACKVSAAIPTKELVKARVDCFLRQAEKEIEEEADEKL